MAMQDKIPCNRIPKKAKWAVEIIEGLGATVESVDTRKHFKYNCECCGERFKLVGSASPSDNRAVKNFRAVAQTRINQVKEGAEQ